MQTTVVTKADDATLRNAGLQEKVCDTQGFVFMADAAITKIEQASTKFCTCTITHEHGI